MSVTVDKSGDRIRRMFGEIAPRYDALNRLLSAGIDRHWRRRTVRLVPPTGTSPILDLCTGTGDLALEYFRASEAEVRVVGADFCHPMLTLGRQKAARAGAADRVSFVEADALELPWGDDEFQIVCVAFGLRNVSDTDRGLREMVRVCQPGGRVAVLEFSIPERQPWRGVYQWYFKHVLPRIGQTFARNRESAYNYLPASVEQFPSGQVLAEWLEAAGLVDVKLFPMTLGVVTLYLGTK